MTHIYSSNSTHLQIDINNIALIALSERLVELEKLICLESEGSIKLRLAIEHRNTLNLYQSEIQKIEESNPLSTPYDW